MARKKTGTNGTRKTSRKTSNASANVSSRRSVRAITATAGVGRNPWYATSGKASGRVNPRYSASRTNSMIDAYLSGRVRNARFSSNGSISGS